MKTKQNKQKFVIPVPPKSEGDAVRPRLLSMAVFHSDDSDDGSSVSIDENLFMLNNTSIDSLQSDSASEEKVPDLKIRRNMNSFMNAVKNV